MRKTWTDAQFEVVSGPRRIGDPHPTRKRWVYAGVDARGRALWYRPPRLTRYQLAACAGGLALAVWLAAIAIGAALHRLH